MDRRDFLKTSLVGAGALAGAGMLARQALAQDKPAEKKAVLKLCSQEGRVPGKSLKEKLDNLMKWGAVGIEFGGNPSTRIKEIQDALKGTTITVAALCWGSHNGDLVSMDMEKRKKGIDDIKAALDTSGELGGTGVIFVPTFNKQSTLTPPELDKVLADILPAIGEYAVKAKSRILIEPLNKKETYYINTVAKAAEICKAVNSPGICLMGDFYHIGRGVEDGIIKSDQDDFMAGAAYLHHVHLATTTSRILPAQEDRSFVDGFVALKKIGFQDFCSLECGCKKGASAEEAIPKAFDFLRKQWEEAKA